MTKYNQLFKQQVVNFYFEHHEKMLLQAVKKLPRNANLILHSDQGIHYQMPSYQRLLAKNRISQSMLRK